MRIFSVYQKFDVHELDDKGDSFFGGAGESCLASKEQKRDGSYLP